MTFTLRRVLLAVFFLFVSVLVFHSCKKEEPDTDTQSSTDNSLCEGEFSRIFPQVNSIAVGDSGVQKGIFLPVPFNGCPDYYIDSADIADGFPVTMWLTYGTDTNWDGVYDLPCIGNDGKGRRGMIEAIFNSPWNQYPSSCNMILHDYYVKDIKGEVKFMGTIVISKSSPANYTHEVQNGECLASGWDIKWNSTRTMSIQMGDTSNVNDDECLISGSASGVDRKGNAFSVEITSPLARKMGCTYIVSGTQTIKIDGKKDRIVDYGDGTCDNLATLTIDGNVFEFTLR